MLRRCLVMLAAVLCLAAASCGGTAGGDDEGRLLIARLDGIYERGIESADETLLLAPDERNSFLLDPAVSPDGSRIAFVVQPPPKVVDGEYDSGSDLWTADRDGAGRRLLYAHEQRSALVRFPAWVSDREVAAVIQSLYTVDGVTRSVYTVHIVDVESGERRAVVQDAIALDASPAGDRLVVTQTRGAAGEALVSVRPVGGPTATLVDQSEGLAPIGYPRYSPDGSLVAFAASDASLGGVPARGGARSGVDGPPQDIWLVDAGGGAPRRVADLKEDSPSLAWDGTGGHIYVLGGLGLYDVNVRNGAIVRIGEGAFHGQLEWAPAR